ncbi:MAG: hypothetical protein NT027_13120 [Proteobacteria bacterium]|nr:hypothetical protein [Pseudomonadota bacterium]
MKVTEGHQKSGVVAVLFLAIAAFIFGALSLSMQTGQIVERRIVADQAADSAVYAFASKSAQGLNYISANNLAIAGVSHMAGVIHLAADWTALLSVFFEANSFCEKNPNPRIPNDKGFYKKPYEWFRPVTKLYFRAGTGLTKINSVIKATFPYLGMVDAIEIAGANAPGAIVLPFGAKPSATTPNGTSTTNETIMKKIKKALKTFVTSIRPNYDGLTKINSDETFCLAYKAGKKAMGGDDYHELAKWMDLGLGGTDLAPIETILSSMASVIDSVGMLSKLISFRVGFSGCGFGEEGKMIGSNEIGDEIIVSGILAKILSGPLSGRDEDLEMTALNRTIQLTPAPGKRAIDLSNELDQIHRDVCSDKTYVNQWKITNAVGSIFQLETEPAPDTGVCYLKSQSSSRHFLKSNRGYQRGETDSRYRNDSSYTEFNLYDIACYGKILFRWETFGGLRHKPNFQDPKNPIPIPTAETHPDISLTEKNADICPSMNVKQNISSDVLYFPRGRPHAGNPNSSHVDLNRDDRSFLAPVFQRLISDDPQNKSADVFQELKDNLPTPSDPSKPKKLFNENAADLLNDALECSIDTSKCHGSDAQGGFFENTAGDKFYPKLSQYNWLCPIQETIPAEAIVRPALSFNSIDNGRWDGRFGKIQEWHNRRVHQLVSGMKCSEWEKYRSSPPKRQPAPRSSGAAAPTNSNNYCNSGAHMCWQEDMKDSTGVGIPKLQEGSLSFTLVGKGSKSADFDNSLHYAVMSVYPLRVDNGSDLKGRNDGSSMAYCPANMDVDLKLDNATSVKVCDVQPVVGLISRVIQDQSGHKTALNKDESFGAGNVNLATGGAFEATTSGTLGTMGFMAIAQSGVQYEETVLPQDPARPLSSTSSSAKNFRMFWPSWKPVFEPSQIMGRVLPGFISPLVED